MVCIEYHQAYKKRNFIGWFLGDISMGKAFDKIDLDEDGEPELVRVGEDSYELRTEQGWLPVHIENSRYAMLSVTRWEPFRGGRTATVVLRTDNGCKYKWKDGFKCFRKSTWIDWPLLPALGIKPAANPPNGRKYHK